MLRQTGFQPSPFPAPILSFSRFTEFRRWFGNSLPFCQRWKSSSPVVDVLEHSLYLRMAVAFSRLQSRPPPGPHIGMWRFYTAVFASMPFIKVIQCLRLWATSTSAVLRGTYHTEVELVVAWNVNLFWSSCCLFSSGRLVLPQLWQWHFT
ncbi:hypothetical protein BGX38DRAFT_202974 [Terfezia claveryi]|nr:hypothetical protein BGX38DRAFT_202974 [Terfezia claveryi]